MTPIHIRAALAFLTVGALGAGLGRNVPAADPPAAEKQALDAHGDPLPKHVRLRLGTERFRQGGNVSGLRLLGDGKTLVTAGDDQTLRWWDVSSGKELRHFTPVNGVGASTLSLDGKTIATMEYDINGQNQTIKIWDTVTGKELRQVGAKQPNIVYTSMGFSPDGKSLAATEQDQNNGQTFSIRLWDVATGKEQHDLKGPDPKEENQQRFMPQYFRFSPDGKILAAVGNEHNHNGAIYLWDTSTGKLLPNLAEQGGPANAGRHEQAFLRPVNGFTLLPHDADSLLFSPDNKQLATLLMVPDKDGVNHTRVRLWDVATGKVIRDMGDLQNGGGSALLFAPTGRIIAAVDQTNQHVHLFETASGKEFTEANVENGINTLAFSPDGQTLALGSNLQQIHLWDVVNGKELQKLKGFAGSMIFFNDNGVSGMGQALAFSPDGKTLMASGGALVRRWTVATGKEIQLPNAGHEGAVYAIVLARDGKLLISVGADNTVRFWDPIAGKETRVFKGPLVEDPNQQDVNFSTAGSAAATLSPDGKTLAVGWQGGQIQLWDTMTGKELKKLDKGHDYGVSALAFAPNGKALASAAQDGRVIWWDVATGKALRQFAGPPIGGDDMAEVPVMVGPTHLAMAPDGRTLAITSTDLQGYKLQLIELATGKARRTFRIKAEPNGFGVPPPGAFRAALVQEVAIDGMDGGFVTYAPDGKSLAWTVGNTIRLWDVVRGREMRRFGVSEGSPLSATFSPDGKYLAAASREGAVYLWEAATGTVLGHMAGHRGGVHCATFASNGSTLASGGADTTVLLWDVPSFLAAEKTPNGEVSAAQLKDLWERLGLEDSEQADEALRSLAGAPKHALPLLRERAKAVQPPDAKLIDKLIEQLEDNRFGVRKKAEDELEKLAELAAPALEKRLADNPPLEVKMRLEKLVQRLNGPVTHPDRLRALRSVEVLEQIGTPEAQEVLQTVSKGAAESRITQEAQSALERLGKKK